MTSLARFTGVDVLLEAATFCVKPEVAAVQMFTALNAVMQC